MGQDNVNLRLEITLEGLVRTEEFDLEAVRSVKVGKLSSSHIRLDHASVSRIHAVIEKRAGDDHISVVDLGSKEGTFLNGKKITKSKLADGDSLRFGVAEATVTIVGASSADAAPVDAVSEPTEDSAVAAQDSEAGLEEPSEAPVSSETSESFEDAPVEAQSDGVGSSEAGELSHASEGEEDGGLITLDDGSQVEPFTLQGYYDAAGNYIPGFYDAAGEYCLGYGYHEDDGQWVVVHGYYDPDGEWVESDTPVSVVGQESFENPPKSQWKFAGTRDSDTYQESFFREKGGDTLEVAMLWSDHILAVSSFPDPRDVVIGHSEKSDFIVSGEYVADGPHALVEYSGGSYTVMCLPEMTGIVHAQGEEYTLEEAVDAGLGSRSARGHQIQVTGNTSVRLDLGATTFLIHLTDQPVLVGGTGAFDTAPLPYMVISAVAHILFVILAMTLPDAARSLDLDGYDANDRFVQLLSLIHI